MAKTIPFTNIVDAQTAGMEYLIELLVNTIKDKELRREYNAGLSLYKSAFRFDSVHYVRCAVIKNAIEAGRVVYDDDNVLVVVDTESLVGPDPKKPFNGEGIDRATENYDNLPTALGILQSHFSWTGFQDNYNAGIRIGVTLTGVKYLGTVGRFSDVVRLDVEKHLGFWTVIAAGTSFQVSAFLKSKSDAPKKPDYNEYSLSTAITVVRNFFKFERSDPLSRTGDVNGVSLSGKIEKLKQYPPVFGIDELIVKVDDRQVWSLLVFADNRLLGKYSIKYMHSMLETGATV